MFFFFKHVTNVVFSIWVNHLEKEIIAIVSNQSSSNKKLKIGVALTLKAKMKYYTSSLLISQTYISDIKNLKVCYIHLETKK